MHHAIFECEAWSAANKDMDREIEAIFTAENMVLLMLASTAKWNRVKEYTIKVLQSRESLNYS